MRSITLLSPLRLSSSLMFHLLGAGVHGVDEYVSVQPVLVQLLVGQMDKRQLAIYHASEVDQYRPTVDGAD